MKRALIVLKKNVASAFPSDPLALSPTRFSRKSLFHRAPGWPRVRPSGEMISPPLSLPPLLVVPHDEEEERGGHHARLLSRRKLGRGRKNCGSARSPSRVSGSRLI